MVLRRAGEPMEILGEGSGSKLEEQMIICVRMSCPNQSSELLF